MRVDPPGSKVEMMQVFSVNFSHLTTQKEMTSGGIEQSISPVGATHAW